MAAGSTCQRDSWYSGKDNVCQKVFFSWGGMSTNVGGMVSWVSSSSVSTSGMSLGGGGVI